MKRLFNKAKVDDYDGSSEHLKKEQNLRKTIDTRIRIFIAILIGLAGVLIYRLYDIQIANADHYETLLEKAEAPGMDVATMRGEILDRDGNIIVSNKSINSITFFPPKGMDSETRWLTAQSFVKNFKVEDDLQDGDLVNLWLLQNDNGDELITEEENLQFQEGDLNQDDIDYLKRTRVDDAMIATLSEEERKSFKIYYAMGTATNSQAAIVLDEATPKDIAFLSENINLFPGFSFSTSWDRVNTEKIDLDTIIGTVSTIPAEKRSYYQALGYQLNDTVGNYGLEYQYEDLLSGVKSEYDFVGDNQQLESIKEGRKGYDLITSLDLDLQAEVEKVLTDTLISTKDHPRRKSFTEMHMVVSDPNTGDILALAAVKRDKEGKYYNDPQSLMLSGFPVGSTIKGATVYMGLDQEIMRPGEIIQDKPLYFKGTKPRASFRNLGPVDDLTSLQLSSNIYMYHVAMRLGGATYIPNGPLIINDSVKTFNTMRNYYSQFGLGVNTQVDYPREENGYKGATMQAGSLLDFSIGQYDNYNALQLNQYIATIANSGYRVKPRFVQEAVNQDTQSVVYENQVEILNKLENEDALARVRQGMRQCVTTNNCGPLGGAQFTSAAKTGTAQDYLAEYKGSTLLHNSFVGFAPYDSPEIAVSCIAPYTYIEEGGPVLTNVCSLATDKIMNNYMNSK